MGYILKKSFKHTEITREFLPSYKAGREVWEEWSLLKRTLPLLASQCNMPFCLILESKLLDLSGEVERAFNDKHSLVGNVGQWFSSYAATLLIQVLMLW